MNVVMLAAGAAGSYCGNCLRDNRLAATLRAQGRNVVLVPLYTPIRTDEDDVSERTLYYGGINVYLQQHSALFRSLPRALDRPLDSPGLLRGLGRRAAKVRPEEVAELAASVLSGEHGRQRKELVRLIAGLRRRRPDVIHLPTLLLAGLARGLRAALGSRIVCTLGGEDSFIDRMPEPQRLRIFELIRERSADVDAFVSPTHFFAARAVEHFGLPGKRVRVVPMGLRTEDFAGADDGGDSCPASGPQAGPPAPDSPGRAFTVGYLARICPEKGLAELAAAVTSLVADGMECMLRVAGYLSPAERPYLESVVEAARRNGLARRFECVGEVTRPQKVAFLRSLDVLCVPAVHPEPKGLYVLEALAAGVPVVGPRRGSFPELIEATGGGVLYDPQRPGALSEALAGLGGDWKRRRGLGLAGQAAVREHFNDRVMAERTWAVYQDVVSAGAARR